MKFSKNLSTLLKFSVDIEGNSLGTPVVRVRVGDGARWVWLDAEKADDVYYQCEVLPTSQIYQICKGDTLQLCIDVIHMGHYFCPVQVAVDDSDVAEPIVNFDNTESLSVEDGDKTTYVEPDIDQPIDTKVSISSLIKSIVGEEVKEIKVEQNSNNQVKPLTETILTQSKPKNFTLTKGNLLDL